MPKVKLTDIKVRTAPAPPSGRLELFDTLLPGFGLRITDKGSRTFFCMFRVKGKQRRMTLGSYPGTKLEEAREEARTAMKRAEIGEDAAAEKIAARKPQEPTADTFEALVNDYFKRDASKRNKAWIETKRLILVNCADWLPRPVEEITRRDVRDLVDGIVDRGSPVMANRLLSYVRRVFAWAVEREALEVNPCRGVKKPTEESARDRVLTDNEAVEVWRASHSLGYPFGPLYRLALLTAQRRGEIASARWRDIDLNRKLWTMPREMTKGDRAHEVPLSDAVVKELEALPRFKASDLVFPSRTASQAAGKDGKHDAEDRAVSGWSRSKRNLDKRVMEARKAAAVKAGADPEGVHDLPHWTIHDLRRTAASGMARLGIAPHVVEKILNHSEGHISGVAAIYNRFAYDDEKRHALNAWAAHVERLLTGAEADNVVRLEVSR